MINRFASPPISELHRSRSYRYDTELFEQSSPYFEALREAEKLVRRHYPSLTREVWNHLNTLLVHECEQSKLWVQLWDTKNDPQRAIDEWHSLSRDAFLPLISRLSGLNKLDERNGYDLRNAFDRSAQFAMSPNEPSEAWLPNINIENNGFTFPTGGPVAQQVELQFLSRLFLGRFPEWLASLDAEISALHSGFELGRRIGPMWLDPPLSRRQVLMRSSDQLATLALIARLQAILRRVVSSRVDLKSITLDSICGDFPSFGSACWQVVTPFVQAVYPKISESSVLKERWSAFRKGRSIRLVHWPERVKRLESGMSK